MILEFLLQLLQAMFHVFSFSRKTLSNSLNIYIKSSNGNTLSVSLDPKWDIKNVKQVIAPKLGLSPEEVKIIFAGKELEDSTVIEDCDLGEQSILHAVKSRQDHTARASKPLNEALKDLQLGKISEADDAIEERVIERRRVHFYVYCATTCTGVREGKLRVRCSACKSGAFTVDSDPRCWSDVLDHRKISGHCEQEGCPDGPVGWAEFYFKCSEHTSQGERDQAVPLYLIRANLREVPCLACTDVSDPVLVFPCEASHVTCLDCFRQYCVSRLQERQFVSDAQLGYTLPCPAGCPNSLIAECHHFRLLTDQQYAQYQRFGAEEYVLKAGGVLCPQPGCGAGILADPDCTRIVCQNGCGFVFCRLCLQGYHIGECQTREQIVASGSSSYSVDPNRAATARWDEASRVTIRVMTKPCPKCRTATERDGGCMHMVCTRCNFHWCWVCQTEWTRDCMGAHWFG
ncbi:E3 ubiquitin-protein ligase parkin-like isoform X1 [Homalodisca vitripennis]|uniref:E3 ubiquitin-protein ligase parkin-like n=1 Tax=Homalodisca vitripennis TaxID=197043 RepID=UPI001EECD010|nr:E3 ubiquitin-protein ligase parkin-like [Homalodisca vitripennis]XP_046684802.1 E3 ubiquitin-protein ligase parkin-like isoform X1 [Homalodisca vitripennis]